MKIKNKVIRKVGAWYFRILAVLFIVSAINQIYQKIN
jgi:hypothetical protein